MQFNSKNNFDQSFSFVIIVMARTTKFFLKIFHSPLHTSPVKLRYLQRRRAIRLLPLPGSPTVATRSGANCLKTGPFFMFASAPEKPTHSHIKTARKTKEFYRNNSANRDLFINIPDKKATISRFHKGIFRARLLFTDFKFRQTRYIFHVK